MSREEELLDPTPLSEDPSIPEGLSQLFRDARAHPGLPPPAIERAIRGAAAAAAVTKAARGARTSKSMLALRIVVVLVLSAAVGLRVFFAPSPEPAQGPSAEPPVADETDQLLERAVDPAPPEEPVRSIPNEIPTSLRPRSQPRPRVSRPEATSREPRPEGSHARPIDSESSEPQASDPPPNEAAMLLRARRILARDPDLALAITAEHSSRYPAGAFTEERETLAIEALTRLGRETEARARARRFEANRPSSPYLDRIRHVLGDF